MKRILLTIIVLATFIPTAFGQSANFGINNPEIERAAFEREQRTASEQAAGQARQAQIDASVGAAAGAAESKARSAQLDDGTLYPDEFELSDSPGLLKDTPPPIFPAGSAERVGGVKIPHNTAGADETVFLANYLLPNIATIIIGIVGGLALIFVIVGGLQLLTSYGDPEKAKKGKQTIIYALAGILIAVLSYAIVAIIAAINV